MHWNVLGVPERQNGMQVDLINLMSGLEQKAGFGLSSGMIGTYQYSDRN